MERKAVWDSTMSAVLECARQIAAETGNPKITTDCLVAGLLSFDNRATEAIRTSLRHADTLEEMRERIKTSLKKGGSIPPEGITFDPKATDIIQTAVDLAAKDPANTHPSTHVVADELHLLGVLVAEQEDPSDPEAQNYLASQFRQDKVGLAEINAAITKQRQIRPARLCIELLRFIDGIIPAAGENGGESGIWPVASSLVWLLLERLKLEIISPLDGNELSQVILDTIRRTNNPEFILEASQVHKRCFYGDTTKASHAIAERINATPHPSPEEKRLVMAWQVLNDYRPFRRLVEVAIDHSELLRGTKVET